ncbi:hypothetical protein KDA_30920 [Dictyobacter alpinus]|uniref:Carrier domain-containing protein n=1 Tax=Dictyobacter alpinus TaxID=2014873 RepID=A0A402B8D0_9CHLR|nr:alpha/beta fold hydrolase [Dictyobacter alpinus]GCE27608.1 hypothetical protein KDA_30920 [Dictyobacter alpinus]
MKMKNVEDLYPLAPMQQAMLAHALYAPDSRVSFEQACELLKGELQLPAFMQAWQQVIQRHSILRTAIISKVVDEPLQLVRQQVPLPLQHVDWRQQAAEEQEHALKALLQADQAQGFELDKAPLLRLYLAQIADDAYYFVWSFHHIILDGWSKDIILNDFLRYYRAAVHHQDIQIERVRPYRDYIAWLQQQDSEKAREAWQQELQGFTLPTPLPMMPPAARQTGSEKHEERRLCCSIETTAALNALAQKSQVTLNVLIQGIWSLYLYHVSGKRDVVFGATVSGRPLALRGSNEMVGLFINILPIRVQVPEATTTPALMTWLQAIQARQLGLEPFSSTPLFHIQQWSEVPWNQSLFDSLLVFENYPAEQPMAMEDALPFQRQNIYGASETNYALTIIVEPGKVLTLQLMYDSRAFDHGAMEQLTSSLQLLLEAVATCSATEPIQALLRNTEQVAAACAHWQGDPGQPEKHAEELQMAPMQRRTPVVAPHNQLEFRLIQLWESVLHVHPIGISDNFFALGGHSLSALQLASQIRKEFQQSFPISLLAQIGTVQQLAQVLRQQGSLAGPQSPVIALRKGAGTPFFCIHPGSGNILCYYRLVQHLDHDQPFYAIHDLDIHKPEFPEIPIEEMASRYIAAIREIQPHGPYALGGFSFGGIIAFEMAQQLRKSGQHVELLALLDSASPLSTQGFENEDNAGFLSVITMEAIRTSTQKTVEEVYADLRSRTLDEQLRYVVDQMVRAGLDPPENGPLGVRHELRIYQTRTRMIQRYRAGVYPGCITVFQAQDHDGLAPERHLDEDWQRFSAQPITTHPVPGYHDTILDEPHVQIMARHLQASLQATCLAVAEGS